MVVADIMTENPITASPDDSVRDVFRTLYENDIRHLPIVDNTGNLVGMISDRDLRTYLVPVLVQTELPEISSDLMGNAVVALMSGDVLSVNPETDVTELIDLFVDHKIGALPVVSPHNLELVGIVSYTDVLVEAKDFF